jgi:hypothetical protein
MAKFRVHIDRKITDAQLKALEAVSDRVVRHDATTTVYGIEAPSAGRARRLVGNTIGLSDEEIAASVRAY